MRIAIITSLLLLISTACGATDFSSASGAVINAGVTGGPMALLLKLSTGVSTKIKFESETYAAITKHQSGDKEYGTSGGATRIYFLDLPSASATFNAPTASDTSAFSSWSSL